MRLALYLGGVAFSNMNTQGIPESELVLNKDGSVYHLHLRAEHIADTVLLVGDQGRVSRISQLFDHIEVKISNREFVTHTGTYKGRRFTALSTGIGTDNIDIAINELDAAVNIDLDSRVPREQKRCLNLIRIGTSGALHGDIPVDSSVISTHGLGFDGLLYYYRYQFSESEKLMNEKINQHLNWDARLSLPYVVEASSELLNLLSPDMIPGITATASGFYGPQGRQLNLQLANSRINESLQSFQFQGHRITNFEMETSALFGLGKILGHKCCTCCAIIANRVSRKYSSNHHIAIDALIKKVLDRLSGD